MSDTNLPATINQGGEVAVRKVVALDEYRDLVELEDMLYETAKEWTERLEEVKARLQAIVGDADAGTLNGREVRTFARTETFQGREFAKAYPNLAQAFTHLVEKPVLDANLVRVYDEKLYQKFQSRAWRRTG